ncbi:hypothetical protein SprV_0802613700 [Sparganum proliferum]
MMVATVVVMVAAATPTTSVVVVTATATPPTAAASWRHCTTLVLLRTHLPLWFLLLLPPNRFRQGHLRQDCQHQQCDKDFHCVRLRCCRLADDSTTSTTLPFIDVDVEEEFMALFDILLQQQECLLLLGSKRTCLYNQVADCLSRPGINAITRPPIDLERMAELQNQPTFTESLQHASLQLEAIPLSTSSGTILCDVSRGASRPVVPSEMRRDVFVALHNLAHPGIRTTQRLFSERFVWPSMNIDIRQWTR